MSSSTQASGVSGQRGTGNLRGCQCNFYALRDIAEFQPLRDIALRNSGLRTTILPVPLVSAAGAHLRVTQSECIVQHRSLRGCQCDFYALRDIAEFQPLRDIALRDIGLRTLLSVLLRAGGQ